MKAIQIFFFSLLYFLVYLTISLAIDLYFGLETSIPELVTIGLMFNLLLIVLLVFEVPDKIAEKFARKKESVLFYITEDVKDDKNTSELLETLEGNATKIESPKKSEEKSNEKIIEAEFVKQVQDQKEENIY
ncbi:hypothetical protein HZA97_07935 [Candidatus Woesearchaeota archaeon]|nr:hypothetical protein [Candidatus Woesearchaeota archaeon]